eukprot:7344090-Pyramimonas_sp.AAC.3
MIWRIVNWSLSLQAGQALSIRVDLLSEEYLKELRQLQDNVPPFPTGKTPRPISEDLASRKSSQASPYILVSVQNLFISR